MNNLPKELETIILDYKSQMECIEMNKVLKELKRTVKYSNYKNVL